MKELLSKHREAIAYYGALIIATLLVATVASSIIRSAFTPAITANATAYVSLVQALTCGRYADAKQFADSAYTTADDADIRKLADFASRMCRMALNTGVQTREEAGSFTGLAKAFVTGFKNPLAGIEGLGMSVEAMFGDWEALGNRLDTRYQTIFSSYRRAQTIGSVTFWLIIAAAAYGYYRYRSQVTGWLRPRIQRLPFIAATPAAAHPTA